MEIKGIIFKKRYCVKCFKFKYIWERSYKPYVMKVTGGSSYCCLKHSIQKKGLVKSLLCIIDF
jgi:hypothetical protein